MNASRLETIGSAAAGIAHDINNQLALIVNHLAATDIEGARQAAERCAALTGSLLSYCKGEPLELSSIDPAAFLKQFAARLTVPAGVQVILHCGDLLPAIMADPAALQRILTNLISNACEAMNGSGTVRLTAAPRMIECSDTGPGIPAGCRKRIFEPFFTTRGARGTGLGLSIVRELMRQLGGSVSVDSEAGRGARFTLRFRAG